MFAICSFVAGACVFIKVLAVGDVSSALRGLYHFTFDGNFAAIDNAAFALALFLVVTFLIASVLLPVGSFSSTLQAGDVSLQLCDCLALFPFALWLLFLAHFSGEVGRP